MTERKAFLLRLPKDLHAELQRWAAQELRSLNAQVEFVLREAVKEWRREKGKREGEEKPVDPGEEQEDRP